MTGYRDDDSSYRSFDIETTHQKHNNLWQCRIYKDGAYLCCVSDTKKKQAYRKAKQRIDLAVEGRI
jgi:hypothetical protein